VVHARVAVFLMRREKARAIYAEKRDEWCVLRFGCWKVDICCWFCGLIMMILNGICGAPKRGTMNGILCSCVRLQYVIIRCRF